MATADITSTRRAWSCDAKNSEESFNRPRSYRGKRYTCETMAKVCLKMNGYISCNKKIEKIEERKCNRNTDQCRIVDAIGTMTVRYFEEWNGWTRGTACTT